MYVQNVSSIKSLVLHLSCDLVYLLLSHIICVRRKLTAWLGAIICGQYNCEEIYCFQLVDSVAPG